MQRIALPALALVTACAPTSLRSAYDEVSPQRTVTAPADTAGAATIAEGWWRAFTLGDTIFLARHTSGRATLTLSNGQGLDRGTLLREAATHVPKPSTFVRPATDVTVRSAAGAVVVTSRVQEGSQGGSNTYRYLTVLEPQGSVWQVLAAHSTREVTLTPRVSAQVAGPLAEYAGSYRGQRGGTLRVAVRDSVLALIDPEGGEARLEPIGPALFELPTLYDGIAVVRFVFTRDADGRVSALNRLIYGSVVSWARSQ